ncbi:MAG: hypothetical protein WAT58_06100 [Candidatus Dormiibacterota bacterium]
MQVVTNMVGGAASGKALDLSLLGQNLTLASTDTTSTVNSVTSTLDAVVNSLGSALSPSTNVHAKPNSGEQKACGVALLSGVLDKVNSLLPAGLGGALPTINGDTACGIANVVGDASNFSATGEGNVTDIRLKLAPAVQDLVAKLHQTIDSTVLNGPVGDVVKQVNTQATSALTQINGVLGGIVGLQLPVIDPLATVGTVLDRLADQDLVRIAIGKSTVENSGNGESFLSKATDAAGDIQILPEFTGAGTPALLEIVIGKSAATVNVNRGTTAASGVADNTILTVKSALLPKLPLDLAKTILPIDALGITSTTGEISVHPGQSLTLLAGTPLESVISVGAASAPVKLDNGHLKVTASAATIHLFKGLGSLALPGGINLGTILNNAQVLGVLNPLLQTAGVGALTSPTDVPGIKLDLAKAEAEAGAVKVENARVDAAAPAKLPRTGGLDLAVPAATLLGGAGGLRVLARRRRRQA